MIMIVIVIWCGSSSGSDADGDVDVTDDAWQSCYCCRQWVLALMDCWCLLVRAHQTHYEQFGRLTGTISIGEYSQVELNVVGVRDHSYGTFTLCFLRLPVRQIMMLLNNVEKTYLVMIKINISDSSGDNELYV